jgi:diaminopimelate epimerase
MKSEKFYKCQATGNDFLFFLKNPTPSQKKKAVTKLCELHTGVGADGVVFLWPQKNLWDWDFYNNDGSKALFCGNAALCTAKLLSHLYPKKKTFLLKNQKQIIEVSTQKNHSLVKFPAQKIQTRIIPQNLADELLLLNERGLSEMALVDAGVPHLVLCTHEIWNPHERNALNLTLCRHSVWNGENVNVSWYSHKNSEAVTFERGVYRETLGCGSGALAIAKTVNKSKSIKLNFPGGKLNVISEAENFLLKGEAHLLFSGLLHDYKFK